MPQPQIVSLVLCQSAVRHADTNNWSLRTCNQVVAPTLPGVLPELCLFMQLSSGRGEYKLKIEVAFDGEPIWRQPFGVRIDSPLDFMEASFLLKNIRLTHAGIHEISVFVDEQILGFRTFLVEVG